MCGLFGVVAAPGRRIDHDDVDGLVEAGKLAQRRGSDASGLILLDDDNIEVAFWMTNVTEQEYLVDAFDVIFTRPASETLRRFHEFIAQRAIRRAVSHLHACALSC